jgi:hypothetical protein
MCITNCANTTVHSLFDAHTPPPKTRIKYRGIVSSYRQTPKQNFYCFNVSVHGADGTAKFQPLRPNWDWEIPFNAAPTIQVQYSDGNNFAGNVFDAVMTVPVQLGRMKVICYSTSTRP